MRGSGTKAGQGRGRKGSKSSRPTGTRPFVMTSADVSLRLSVHRPQQSWPLPPPPCTTMASCLHRTRRRLRRHATSSWRKPSAGGQRGPFSYDVVDRTWGKPVKVHIHFPGMRGQVHTAATTGSADVTSGRVSYCQHFIKPRSHGWCIAQTGRTVAGVSSQLLASRTYP